MIQTFKGDITNNVVELNNNVVELNLQAGATNIGTPTVAYDGTNNGEIAVQVMGDVDEFSGFKLDGTLKGLVIGTSCTTIGSNAFYNCTILTGDLVIPDSVTTIGDQVFYNGSGFTGNLVIPDSVTSIGSYAFYFCNNLSVVYTNTPASSFTGSGAFYGTTFSTIYTGQNATGYTSSFQGRTGLTIANWDNYPNPIPN
jgi:hypothetical protein